MLQKLLQEVQEVEMDAALQAGKSERTTGRTPDGNAGACTPRFI